MSGGGFRINNLPPTKKKEMFTWQVMQSLVIATQCVKTAYYRVTSRARSYDG